MTLDTAFDTFVRDAWRLEVLDTYDVPGTADRMATFTATGTVAASPGWTEVITTALARGARIGRVRLVGHPITDYTRFEMVAYRNNVSAGEDVRLVDRQWLDSTWDAAPDFWMIDGRVWLMHYSPTGVFLNAVEIQDTAPYAELRRRIEPVSVPLADFHLADIPAMRSELAHPASLPAELATTG